MPRQPPIDILPIQIREDLTVQIAGIPHDMTKAEADKIARVVLAMAMERAQNMTNWQTPFSGLPKRPVSD
jgi:hypothetical protein